MYTTPPIGGTNRFATNAVINTLSTATIVAGVATKRYRVAWISATLDQNMTGVVRLEFRDNVTSAILAILALSPQSPYAATVFPEPGMNDIGIGHGLQIASFSNVVSQTYTINYGYLIDTVT